MQRYGIRLSIDNGGQDMNAIANHACFEDFHRFCKSFDVRDVIAAADDQGRADGFEKEVYALAILRAVHNGDFGEELESFDLLISQYAGFISPVCKVYLKVGGILVANDSHGDASMAVLDPDFELIAVARRRSGKYSLSEKGLEQYFVPKKEIEITPEYLRGTGKGVPYTRWVSNYVFRRVA